MKKKLVKALVIGNIYCIVFVVIGMIFGMQLTSIANGLFYSMAIYIIVGLIALISPRKTLRKRGEAEKEDKLSLKEKFKKGSDVVSQGYRVFLYCFEIAVIIIIYSYFVYEIGVM